MNKQDLINAVAEGSGLKKVEAEKAIKATIDAISGELAGGGNVTLVGFGSFSVFERQARTGKNPQTGASIQIAAKKVAKFKPGKALAESVNPVAAKKPAAKKKAAKKK
ncbi:MAG: HU family DNA-binding protein [Candidatus Kapabacteria bacterium]|nr:HU family DNA-binding protein [Ignavibacteriota bacterium]MCW5884473.1 HU family DNA-binding protein [Candidatus Kapabacteria bacterium]